MKIVTIKGCDCFTGVPNFISISQAVYELSGFKTLKIGHTRTYIRTPAKNYISRRYFEYSDTNFSNFFFHKNIASSVRKNKYIKIWSCTHVSTNVKVHEKNLINFLKTKWRRRISQANPFFWTASSAGPLPVAILHLE